MALQLRPGTVTGVGSLPGDDPLEACRLVFGELPDLPHLPELPARGPGADMIGRAAALLVDLPVDLQPSGWRMVARAGIDARRARDFLARDLDALTEVAEHYAGPLKVQAAGLWTLASAIELSRGDKLLADHGAVRDLADSLTEGLRAHLALLRRRVPAATLVLQLDEPALPDVLSGRVPTASGYGTLDAVEHQQVQAATAGMIAAADAPVVVHSCAPGAPVDLLRRAGAAGISLDASLLRPADDDDLGVAVEADVALFLGVLPGTDTELPGGPDSPGAAGGCGDEAAAVARRLWRRLGFGPELLASRVVLQPRCGFAGAGPDYVRLALGRLRKAARSLASA